MNSASDVSQIILLTLLLLPLVGVMMAITPYLMKKSECFAVTVPENALHDPYLKGLKCRYASTMIIITVLLSALGLVLCLAGNSEGVLGVLIVVTLVLCLGGYGLMLYYRQKVRLYKKEKGWKAEHQVSVAVMSDEEMPRAISLKWNLLHLPVMLMTLIIGFAGYNLMPDLIPRQIGFDGEVSSWITKSPLVPFVPVLIQAFFAVTFAFTHWTITRSKKWSNPNAPTTSALAYGLFARAQSMYLLALGLLLSIALIAMPLSFMGILELVTAGLVIMIIAFIAVIGGIAISVVYGQGGSRIFTRMQESEGLPADDDAYWKLGIFYFNPADPSLFLLERFGIGWTINWARPGVWAIIAGGLLVTAIFLIGIFVTMG